MSLELQRPPGLWPKWARYAFGAFAIASNLFVVVRCGATLPALAIMGVGGIIAGVVSLFITRAAPM